MASPLKLHFSATASTKMTFCQLPEEIIGHIAHYASDELLAHFRQTCKLARRGSEREFGIRVFKEVNHVMTLYSLNSLSDLWDKESAPIVFTKYIEKVIFNTIWLSPSASMRFDWKATSYMMKSIFKDIKENQTKPITIGFSDNFPKYDRDSCDTEEFYRVSEKPSHGWKDMRERAARPLPPDTELDSTHLADLVRSILPIATGSGCDIKGLEFRLVGNVTAVHWSEFFVDNASYVLREFGVEDWDMRVIVVKDKEVGAASSKLPTVTFEAFTKKLTFKDFVFGQPHDRKHTASLAAVEFFSVPLEKQFKHLQLTDCRVLNNELFKQQLDLLLPMEGEPIEGEQHSHYVETEKVTIDGLELTGLWHEVLTAFSNIKGLKAWSARGIKESVDTCSDVEFEGDVAKQLIDLAARELPRENIK